MKDPNITTTALLNFLLEQEVLPPIGWFNCLPGMYSWGLVELNDPVRNEQFDEEDWYKLYRRFETPSPESDHQLIPLVEKHAWLIGRLGLAPLAERIWPGLSRSARGNYLAGISNHMSGDSAPAFTAKAAEADFSPAALCELAVNRLAQDQWQTVIGLLDNPTTLTGEIQRFVAFRSKVLNRKYKAIDALSHRVVDILLEAALRLGKTEAVGDLLNRGASPNIGLWQVFSSCSHRYCALSYAIKNDLLPCVPLLLDAGATPDGNKFSGQGQPLLFALHGGNWSIADLLLQRGARFDGGKLDNFGVFHPSDETVEWVRQIAGQKFPLEPIITKPQCDTPFDGMYGMSHTYLTAMLGRADRLNHLKKYVLLGLDARPTAEELAYGIELGDVSCLEYLLDLAKAPELVRTQFIPKAQSFADERAKLVAAAANK